MDLHELLDKTVSGLGYELVDVEQSPRGRVLRVFIDRADKDGSIDIEDCTLDRVLKKQADFERFAGSEINLRLRVPMAGRRNFNGVLLGVHDGRVRLTVDTGDVELEFGNIDKARLVPKFD